jgi:hypothetical protein
MFSGRFAGVGGSVPGSSGRHQFVSCFSVMFFLLFWACSLEGAAPLLCSFLVFAVVILFPVSGDSGGFVYFLRVCFLGFWFGLIW